MFSQKTDQRQQDENESHTRNYVNEEKQPLIRFSSGYDIRRLHKPGLPNGC
jgi:hypothetical protein